MAETDAHRRLVEAKIAEAQRKVAEAENANLREKPARLQTK